MAKNIQVQGESPRFWALQRREAIWNGQRYALEGRPSFWDNSVPLRDRAPAVQSHLPRTAGMRLVHMVFGERSFPNITCTGGGYGVLLSKEDVAAISALITELAVASDLPAAARSLLVEGLKVGTSVSLQNLCEGVPHIRIFPAKWCTPTFDQRGRVTAMVIEYKYPDPNVSGQFCWYHREINGSLDRVWQPVPVTATPPEWSKLPLASEALVEFTSVTWTRCLAEKVDEGVSLDGHALCDGLEDEIEALDLLLSQHYRTAGYNGDPQVVRIGLDVGEEGSAPAPMGEQGREAQFSWFNSFLPEALRRSVGGGGSAIKKGPNKIWDLPTGSDAKLLESNGKPAEILEGSMAELRRVITDAMGVVLADPAVMGKGELSARALALLQGPTLDTCDNLRAEYGKAILDILCQFLRLCAGPEAATSGVHLASWEGARSALSKLWVARPDGTQVWVAPTLNLAWGEYVEPAWSDISAAVDATSKATGGKPVMSRRRAATLLAPLTGVTDVASELAEIDSDEPTPLPGNHPIHAQEGGA